VHPFYGDMGFVNPTAEVTFPLSHSHLLLMTLQDESYPPTLSPDLVDFANQARAAYADRYLYAAQQDQRIVALAENFRDSRPSTTTEGLGPQKFGKISIGTRRRGPLSERDRNDPILYGDRTSISPRTRTHQPACQPPMSESVSSPSSTGPARPQFEAQVGATIFSLSSQVQNPGGSRELASLAWRCNAPPKGARWMTSF
jgi:hypothetical protein